MLSNISLRQILICITIALFSSSVGFFIGVYDEQSHQRFFTVTQNPLQDSCEIPVISINQI